jgi:hypothetical protein
VSLWLQWFWPWFLLVVGVEVSDVVKVSRCQVSSSQSFVVSVCRGVKVSECAVKILARSLVSSHFC